MSASEGNGRRQVVPRWRRWWNTVASGELKMSFSGVRDVPAYDADLHLKYVAWERHQSAGRTAEYLSTAFLQEDGSPETFCVAQAAATAYPLTLVGELAAQLQRPKHQATRPYDPAHVEEPSQAIHALRFLLRRNPRNAVRWVDLARAYAILGQPEQAQRSMRTALQLAPDDRFTLRAASALAVQQQRPDDAIAILRRSRATSGDPWLAASLVAITDLAGGVMPSYRQASALLGSQQFTLSQTTELYAALGTAEISAGSDKRGRKLLRNSLLAPNENTYAQVEWVSDNLSYDLLVESSDYKAARAYEASALRCANRLEWRSALLATREWLIDQPFSASAANFGAWCACELEDWTTAISFAERGLRANPDEAILLNNLAFSQASSGAVREAIGTLRRARTKSVDSLSRASLYATEGFVLFRQGHHDLARTQYGMAVEAFARQRNEKNAARAALYLAREEAMAGTVEAPEALARARLLAAESGAPEVTALLRKVEGLLHPSGYGAEKRRAVVNQRRSSEPILDRLWVD